MGEVWVYILYLCIFLCFFVLFPSCTGGDLSDLLRDQVRPLLMIPPCLTLGTTLYSANCSVLFKKLLIGTPGRALLAA